MQERMLELPLNGFGSEPGDARVALAVLSPADRLKRAAVAVGAGLAVALIALPIPIVHLVLVPGGILLGLVLAGVRLSQHEIFRGAEGRCPFCGTQQQFNVSGRFRLPKTVTCVSCRRELALEPRSVTT